ncbi:MAG: transglutaminase domain-containing protein [Planctomycetes bacterium]|nr:transglutaminase domain-containing protein [Planctomycetota bacterium]
MKKLATWVLGFFVPIAGVIFAAPIAAAAQENLLQNGDFEKGAASPVHGWHQIYPPTIQKPAPFFGRIKVKPKSEELGVGKAKSGESYGVIETNKPGGFSSLTQTGKFKGKNNLISFSSWLRVDEIGAGSAAYLIVLFMDGDGNSLGMKQSRRLTSVGDWKQLQLETVIPEGAEEWMVRCGIMGQARVGFDDAQLITSKIKGDLVAMELAVHHGDYIVRTPFAKKEAWVALSIPFPFERQSPLAIKVTTDPPEMVERLEIFEDRENRPLRVVMKKMARGDVVKVHVETLTMVSDRATSDGSEVKLANPKKVPKEIRQHLQAAPGVDAKDKRIKGIADGFDRKDFASLMNDVKAYLKANLKYDGGNPQGATDCLDLGKAVCTGYANVAASLLIAADVPTRILACTQLSGRLQEHYIVEAWTPDLGWSRMESTMAAFPWSDSSNLILRVVYPDSERSQVDVPLFVEVSNGAIGGFRMDPKDTCWQGADHLSGMLMSDKGFAAVEATARKNFEALIKKPSAGEWVRLVPELADAKKLKLDDRSKQLLVTVDDWLNGN